MTPIVVVAYNRPGSLKRLLGSLASAEYETDGIPLIISIDKGDNKDVLEIAEAFEWKHGEKIIKYQPENLKLRKHILKCGDLSQEYGSVIILEDDLYVSKSFYKYATQALEFTANDEKVGGVSLYSHQYNVNIFEPFLPVIDGYDNWYFQFASSWGEAWTAKQWSDFRTWYDVNCDKDLRGDVMPATVTSWSNSSWLKYFIRYLVETDKYFLYPRDSHTTNFSDVGVHAAFENTTFQVPLGIKHGDFNFSTVEQSGAVYDAFFENTRLAAVLDVDAEQLCVDLYGSKPLGNKKYLLTSKIYDYKIVRSFARSMRPIDANVYACLDGKELFLYDTEINEKNEYTFDEIGALRYRMRIFRRSTYFVIFKMFVREIVRYVAKKFKK